MKIGEGNQVQVEFCASSADELSQVGDKLFAPKNRRDQGGLDEQVQMTRLLESLSGTNVFVYPLVVRHTPALIPDFQLQSGEHKISVEMAKVTTPELETARSLQSRKGLNRTLAVHRLARRFPTPLTRHEIVQRGFGIPQFDDSPTLEQERAIWLELTLDEINDKTGRLGSPDFRHGDEDWLVLWDRLGTAEWQVQSFVTDLASRLTTRWMKTWFRKVFIQDDHFSWTCMICQEGVTFLPDPRGRQTRQTGKRR